MVSPISRDDSYDEYGINPTINESLIEDIASILQRVRFKPNLDFPVCDGPSVVACLERTAVKIASIAIDQVDMHKFIKVIDSEVSEYIAFAESHGLDLRFPSKEYLDEQQKASNEQTPCRSLWISLIDKLKDLIAFVRSLPGMILEFIKSTRNSSNGQLKIIKNEAWDRIAQDLDRVVINKKEIDGYIEDALRKDMGLFSLNELEGLSLKFHQLLNITSNRDGKISEETIIKWEQDIDQINIKLCTEVEKRVEKLLSEVTKVVLSKQDNDVNRM